ncbi:hypothetical protein [Methylibium rhizosphaerae]|uniref:hypothetical protein n=1 Tax=Methylibium rhizosphaerae TaxID=2570323 RepID=UPI00112CEBBA|nr:hypothetical protein [Methylibium rhizosphaerae]
MQRIGIPRRNVLRLGRQAAVLAAAPALRGQQAVSQLALFNPGESVGRGAGPLWRIVSAFMQSAVDALGLEVQYGEGHHLLMRRQAQLRARAVPASDYVIPAPGALPGVGFSGQALNPRLGGFDFRLERLAERSRTS